MADVSSDGDIRYELEYRLVNPETPIDGRIFTAVLKAKNNRDAKAETQLFVDANWAPGTAVEVIALTSVITITSTVRDKVPFP